MDEFINEWAEKAEDIYKYQTAGDYTWRGFLHSMVHNGIDRGLLEDPAS